MNYRLYLLDSNLHIRAGVSFSATNDGEAIDVATSVHEACADVIQGYELWDGPRPVVRSGFNPFAASRLRFQEMTRRRQKDLLDLEDQLHRSFACIRKSRKLIEVTRLLRQSLDP